MVTLYEPSDLGNFFETPSDAASRRCGTRRTWLSRHDRKPTPMRVLLMELRIGGDRLTDETGEYEVIGRPYTTQMGKNVHVRVKRVENAEVTMIRTYAAHERISVKRAGRAEEGKR